MEISIVSSLPFNDLPLVNGMSADREYNIAHIRERALGAIQQSVVIADADLEGLPVIFANREFSKLTGFSSDEIAGLSSDFLAGPETAEDERKELRNALATERPYSGLILNYRKDGSAFWNETSFTLLDDQGHGRFWMATQTDVTERRELEARLHESRRMEAIGKLSGGIAHDFNNILALILGNAEIIAREAANGPHTRDAAADIMEAADGGSKLVKRMLQYARAENAVCGDVQLNAAVSEIVAVLTRTISDRVAIQTDLSAAIGRVQMDRTLFETALTDLVLNARDAMRSGGTIQITTRRRINAGPRLGTVAVVSVSDSGTGMDEATVARAFQPFFTTKTAGRGKGLGLAMVYNFVKQSGGDVTIETEPGKGATVTMLLPIEDAAIRSAAGSEPVSRVLLVEDETKIRKVIALHLEQAGYQVDQVGSAAEASELIDHGLIPALLLSDIRLGEGMTGVQLTMSLRERGHDFPMLLMTGFAEELDGDSNMIAGVPVLRKPFRTDDLLAEIDRRIGERNQDRVAG